MAILTDLKNSTLVRYGIAVLAGLLTSLAMPPHAPPPLSGIGLFALAAGFTTLLLLIDRCRTKLGAFGLAWVWALAFFMVGLSWISEAFQVDSERYGWMGPIITAGLAMLMACYPALAAAAYKALGLKGIGRFLAFAALWAAAEWLRGHLFTGFPWHLAAYALSFSDALIQAASLLGAYGLTLVVVLAATAPAVFFTAGAKSWERIAGASLSVLVAAGLWFQGQARLPPVTHDGIDGVMLRIVQPNIPQRLKWVPELRDAHLRRLLAISTSKGHADATHIIWPEAATPFYLPDQSEALTAIGGIVPEDGAVVTGTPRRARTESGPAYFNAMVAVNAAGAITNIYDKHHLVPVGEYVPLRGWLPVERLAAGRGDFTAGPGPRSLDLPGLPPVTPLICYEAIFPGAIPDDGPRPEWLLNVTNDSWFGSSAGPHQHLAISRFRAVEQGIPLIRAANTGISAIIDPYGRMIASLGLNKAGVIDGALPRSLEAPTPYARFGDLIFFALCVLLAAFGVAERIRAVK